MLADAYKCNQCSEYCAIILSIFQSRFSSLICLIENVMTKILQTDDMNHEVLCEMTKGIMT